MKRTLLALSVAVGLASISAASYAALPGTWDIGLRGGWAHTNFDSNQYVTDDDDNGFGLGLNVGYNFTSWFGLELGYNYFDGFSTKGKEGTEIGSADYTFHGPELALRFAIPLDDKGSDVYLRAGGMYVIADNDDVGGNETNLSPFAGVGVKYNVTKSFSARLGYDYYFDVYDEDCEAYNGVDTDIGFLYLGFAYTFGGEPAPVPVAEPAPQPQHVNETFSLEAGALFPFDGSNLTDEGNKAVSDVVAEVQAKNVTNATYTVKGYTDRLGAEAYNQKLSAKRADTVANALITSGVPQDAIVSVEGLGEANPVTGTSCDGLKGNDLKQCLAPDRRVEISVEGDIVVEQAPAQAI